MTKQYSNLDFTGGRKIVGLSASTADGEPVVHQQLSGVVGGLVYQGGWNATTNSPTIPTAAAGNKGQYYVVTTAGTTTIDGHTNWAIGDWIVSNGTTWDKIDNTEAAATDTAPGTVELATQAEVNTGTDTTRVITPATLAGSDHAKLKFSQTFGDGTTLSFTFTHNFNTQDVIAVVREVAGHGYVVCDIANATVNTVTVTVTGTAPAANALRITIIA